MCLDRLQTQVLFHEIELYLRIQKPILKVWAVARGTPFMANGELTLYLHVYRTYIICGNDCGNVLFFPPTLSASKRNQVA